LGTPALCNAGHLGLRFHCLGLQYVEKENVARDAQNDEMEGGSRVNEVSRDFVYLKCSG